MNVASKEGHNLLDHVRDHESPIIFLGLADGLETHNSSNLLESWSLFRVARIKAHFTFPAILRQAYWCFIVRSDLPSESSLRVQIINNKGVEQAHLNFGVVSIAPLVEQAEVPSKVSTHHAKPEKQTALTLPDSPGVKPILVIDKGQWILQAARIDDLLIYEPGEYRLVLNWADRQIYLGKVIFGYVPPAPLTDERIAAIEADPLSPKFVQISFSCKHCSSKINVYCAIKEQPSEEVGGSTFYRNIADRFVCECGKTDMNLVYLRESMHCLLSRDARGLVGETSFVQRYAQERLLEVASQFLALVQKEKKEEPIQKFLEENKVLFARFHAKQLFVKPRILGKFNADFAFLDSEGVLTLVELERPTMRLFKKNGHLRGDLNHAYEQVQDWLDEVIKHRAAVIDGLDLKQDDVLSIRGCVIAGRSKLESRDHLRRHMSQPRHGIDFCTLDMLGQSLTRIAEDLSKSK